MNETTDSTGMNRDQSNLATAAEQKALLEAFVVDNPELERLEDLLSEFNLFEALGAVRQEIRHSDFLSYLLDPTANHGLGDRFTKSFLKRVLNEAEQSPVSPIEVDVADFSDSEVRREWRDIDVLIHAPGAGLVVAVENKIDSGEHSDQLRRYRETLEREFPGHVPVLVFLTPDGVEAKDSGWMPCSYEAVAELVEKHVETDRTRMGADPHSVLRQYGDMLRRHIVADSPIEDLCRRIYRQHKPALDLIFEHRPDLQAEIGAYLEQLIGETNGVVPDVCTKSVVRFAPESWDSIDALATSSGWTRTGRILLFELVNRADSLSLVLQLGPGNGSVRKALHEHALENPRLYPGISKSLGKKWTQLGSKRQILAPKDYSSMEFSDLTDKIDRWWARFMDGPYSEIRDDILSGGLEEIDLTDMRGDEG